MSMESHKTDHIPELSPHYSETHRDDQLGGNTYRMDPLLELELAKYCDGEAKNTIVHCALLEPEEGYRKALEFLEEAFGQKHIVPHTFIDKMLNIPSIKRTDPYNLRRLSREMHICELTLTQMNYVTDLYFTRTIECMFLKLPLHLQSEWVKVACRILKTDREPSFKDLCEFVKEQSDIANTRYGLLVNRGSNSVNKDVGVLKGKISTDYNAARISYASASDDNAPLLSSSCLECSSNHSLDQCQKFKDKNVRERKEFVLRHKLCNVCLKANQVAKNVDRRGRVLSKAKEELEDKFDQLYSTEFKDPFSRTISMSVEDRIALSAISNSVQRLNGHYQMALPWRHNHKLPNNRELAERRLSCLKGRLIRDKKLFEDYVDSITRFLSLGGFNLTKWTSNSVEVLEFIPEEDRAEGSIIVCESNETSKRTLGIEWNVRTDELCFKVHEFHGNPTRRNVLSYVASIFDPIGFVAPIILPAEVILQDTCRQKLDWDTELTIDCQAKWNNWCRHIKGLDHLRIPMCLKPGFEPSSAQIHCFADAPELAYGVVAYIRYESVSGQIHCSFLLANSRVAPLKLVTIPRMELTACVLCAKIGRHVREQLSIPISSVIYWIDSTVVFHCIKNTTKRFEKFVSNRLETIHELSTPRQWRYVKGKLNPADHAARGLSLNDKAKVREW
ncbi:unnamed protein product [Schistosoma margrebowiei]|uniref:Uncharacterized protein n=1 Tax=Schistosoma margrebowiei TaxID=48269 RepID=A0A183N8M2_9TREM|nr:unnamed protein product [Schistosoma margrebowiei]